MDPVFCIHVWDLEPDFKIVELKRTNEENEKDLWWCHSYNGRGRPWSSWKVRKVKPEYQIHNIWYHAHKSISAGFQSEDFPRCSSVAVQLQQGLFLRPFPGVSRSWGRRMDEWGPGGSSEGRCTQMAGRSSEAPFSFVLQFAGTALEVKMGFF